MQHPAATLFFCSVALFAMPLATACAQKAAPARAGSPQGPDPYTAGDEAALGKAGYVSFGPFEFGTNHTTTDVEALLPNEPLVWIETAHFRIGSALPALSITSSKDREWVTKVREELMQVALRLPSVNPNTSRLDPWLRAPPHRSSRRGTLHPSAGEPWLQRCGLPRGARRRRPQT
jgi:hypothetical protein